MSDKGSNKHSKQLLLRHHWTFYFDEGNTKRMKSEDYQNKVQEVGTFNTVHGFWRFYNNLLSPSKFPDNSNLRMFKGSIKPTWEDPANVNGGKWVISSEKHETGEIWIKVILAVIGLQFTHNDVICGVVLSVRSGKDTINIWNTNSDTKTVEFEDTAIQLSKLLKVPPNKILYRPHILPEQRDEFKRALPHRLRERSTPDRKKGRKSYSFSASNFPVKSEDSRSAKVDKKPLKKAKIQFDQAKIEIPAQKNVLHLRNTYKKRSLSLAEIKNKGNERKNDQHEDEHTKDTSEKEITFTNNTANDNKKSAQIGALVGKSSIKGQSGVAPKTSKSKMILVFSLVVIFIVVSIALACSV